MDFFRQFAEDESFSGFMRQMWHAANDHKLNMSEPPKEKRRYIYNNVRDISPEVMPNDYYSNYIKRHHNARLGTAEVFTKSKYMPLASGHAYRSLKAEMEEYKHLQAKFKGDYSCKGQ